MEREFQDSSPSLVVGCYYGGVDIGQQIRQLRAGVDVAVGTPGRFIDLINRGNLNLGLVRNPDFRPYSCCHEPAILLTKSSMHYLQRNLHGRSMWICEKVSCLVISTAPWQGRPALWIQHDVAAEYA